MGDLNACPKDAKLQFYFISGAGVMEEREHYAPPFPTLHWLKRPRINRFKVNVG